MATIKLQDNLPMVGRLEGVRYCPAKPNPQDASKTLGPDLRLQGRWVEHRVGGAVELGAGDVYLRTDHEQTLIALGVLALGPSDAAGIPSYRVVHPGPIQILRTADGTRKLYQVSLAGGTPPAPATAMASASTPAPAPAPAAPSPPAPAAAPMPSGPALNGNGRHTETDEEKKARIRRQFADWLEIGEAYAAALILAKQAADIAGAPTSPESLQAAAATILIQADRSHVVRWRGLAPMMQQYLAPKPAPVAAAGYAGKDSATDWPPPATEGDEGELPF